jgi:hypothetical protein
MTLIIFAKPLRNSIRLPDTRTRPRFLNPVLFNMKRIPSSQRRPDQYSQHNRQASKNTRMQLKTITISWRDKITPLNPAQNNTQLLQSSHNNKLLPLTKGSWEEFTEPRQNKSTPAR